MTGGRRGVSPSPAAGALMDGEASLATLLARQGQWDDARRHWQQALELDPGYEDARRNLQLLDQVQRK